jgi:hypothetical protein
MFQQDFLSLLFFSIALVPLTYELNKVDCGYQIHGAEKKLDITRYK